MKVLAKTGQDDVAVVYLAETEKGHLIEFAESLQPSCPLEKKWILCLSTLYGCPVDCLICDAGGSYQGKLTQSELLEQIDFMVRRRFPNGKIPVEKFKIQFSRMGEPAFNPHVLDVLEQLPEIYEAPGLIPSISTIAPMGSDGFFEKLLALKNKLYGPRFQFQFSIHTTDASLKNWLIPAQTWDFPRMAEYGREFCGKTDRKVTLNFALAQGMPVDAGILLQHFEPEHFIIKITPVNPTYKAITNRIYSVLPDQDEHEIFTNLRAAGYEVIISIGDLAENAIGSNCGQYVTRHLQAKESLPGAYHCHPEEMLSG
jgi:23S rRNA (adenine2503-C2)-methyltransferase